MKHIEGEAGIVTDPESRRRIVLARHGQTDWNRTYLFQGKTDIPLNDAGREQAHALAERLSPWEAEVVYSSPLERAMYTAEVIAKRLGLSPVALPELQEVDFGTWEGRSILGLKKERSADFERWNADPFFNPPPGAETWDDIKGRLARAVRRMLDGPQSRIVAVSHGGIMRGLYAVLLGFDPHTVWRMNVSNCAMSGVEWRAGRASLMFSNDDLHIRGGAPGRKLPIW